MSLSTNPKYQAFSDEEKRKLSFEDFPKDRNIDTKKLAIGGFYYVGDPDVNGDMCRCHFCGLSLHKWEPEDDPWEEHHKHGQNCMFHLSIQEEARNNSQFVHPNYNVIPSHNHVQNYVQPPTVPVKEGYFVSNSQQPPQVNRVGVSYNNYPESQPQYNVAGLNPHANQLLAHAPSHSIGSHLLNNQHSQELTPHASGAAIEMTSTPHQGLLPQTHYETHAGSSQLGNNIRANSSNWKPGDILTPVRKPQSPSQNNPIQPTSNILYTGNLEPAHNNNNNNIIPHTTSQVVNQDQRYFGANRLSNSNFGVPEMKTHSTITMSQLPQQIPPQSEYQQKQSSAPHPTLENQPTRPTLVSIMTNTPVVSISTYQRPVVPQSQASSQFQVRSQIQSRIASQIPGQISGQIPGQISSQISGQIPGQIPGQIQSQIPGQIPGYVPGKIPGYVPGKIPGYVPGKIPGYVPGQIPDQIPDQIPGRVLSNTPPPQSYESSPVPLPSFRRQTEPQRLVSPSHPKSHELSKYYPK